MRMPIERAYKQTGIHPNIFQTEYLNRTSSRLSGSKCGPHFKKISKIFEVDIFSIRVGSCCSQDISIFWKLGKANLSSQVEPLSLGERTDILCGFF